MQEAGTKKYKTPSQQKKLSMVAYVCHPSYSRKHSIEGSQSKPDGSKSKTYLKNNQSKNGWKHDLRSRVLAKQMQSPEFKLQYCQNTYTHTHTHTQGFFPKSSRKYRQ
jgi:hypothetical protein